MAARIYATSPTSVWITATVSGTSGLELVHLHGDRWTSYTLARSLPVSAVNTDGVPPNALGRLDRARHRGIAAVPGRKALWAVGSTPQGSGSYPYSSAVI
jgi:hypothetical protein